MIFFSVLQLSLAGITICGMNAFLEGSTQAQVAKELALGERVFSRILLDKSQQPVQAASMLAADFGFLESVAGNDEETLLSALDNQRRRIKAEVMMMIALDGRVSANTERNGRGGKAFPHATLLAKALATGQASGIAVGRHGLYQMVLVPARAPAIIGRVAMGFAVKDQVANELSGLTGLTVSFLAGTSGAPWRFAASSRAARNARRASPSWPHSLSTPRGSRMRQSSMTPA